MAEALSTYQVSFSSVSDFSTFSIIHAAKTAAAARYLAFLDLSDAWNITFRDFLRISRVRKVSMPADAGYAYIKRAYGVDLRAGQRVKITGEGPDLEGRGATVVYPGDTTAHAHVLIDGIERVSIIHPFSIVVEAQIG